MLGEVFLGEDRFFAIGSIDIASDFGADENADADGDIDIAKIETFFARRGDEGKVFAFLGAGGHFAQREADDAKDEEPDVHCEAGDENAEDGEKCAAKHGGKRAHVAGEPGHTDDADDDAERVDGEENLLGDLGAAGSVLGNFGEDGVGKPLESVDKWFAVNPVFDEVGVEIPELVHHEPKSGHDEKPADQARFGDVDEGAFEDTEE